MCKAKTPISILSAVLLAGLLAPAQLAAQENFASAEAAATALVDAAKSGDKKAVLKVLGPQGGQVVTSGDAVADKAARARFIAAYDKKHAVAADGDKATLVIGEEDFPFPIPIVRKDNRWSFDTRAGLDEVLRRRVGRNELSAIEVARAYVQAQNEYAELNPEGQGPHTYAQKIVSSPGKKDGLYWPAAEGQPESPLGDLFADASAEGYKPGARPIPYHGYYYRILKRQGAGAQGGAFDYVVDGKMIGGFALVAYPAAYGNSGIMTFMVNHDGQVFEKDLGAQTGKEAPAMEAFAPDATWKKAEAQP
jgi:hypothetical protein